MVEWQKKKKCKLSLLTKLQQIKKFPGKLSYKNQLQENLTSMSFLTWIKVFLAWLRWAFSLSWAYLQEKLQITTMSSYSFLLLKLLNVMCETTFWNFNFGVLGCYFWMLSLSLKKVYEFVIMQRRKKDSISILFFVVSSIEHHLFHRTSGRRRLSFLWSEMKCCMMKLHLYPLSKLLIGISCKIEEALVWVKFYNALLLKFM